MFKNIRSPILKQKLFERALSRVGFTWKFYEICAVHLDYDWLKYYNFLDTKDSFFGKRYVNINIDI